MSLATLATATPVHWDLSALLAVPSALAVQTLKLSTGYAKEVGGKTLGGMVRRFPFRLSLLAALEGATGLAATALVVLLGVTQPGWLDTPLGWLLLGTVGPAMAAASIGTVKLGGQTLNLGLSLIYLPLRQLLLEPVDDAIFTAARPYQQTKEVLYRRLAQAAFDGGQLQLSDLTNELRRWSRRGLRSSEDRRDVEEQLSFIERSHAPVGVDPHAWERDQLGTLVAFLVEKRFFAPLDSVVGEPSAEERQAVEPPPLPPGAAE
jgi:hypothetical protein